MRRKSKKRPHYRLSIYLLKDDIKTPDDAIKVAGVLEHETLHLDGIEAELYVQPAYTKAPRWSKLFEGVIDLKKLGIRSSNAAAAMVVPAAGRLFAVTFGFGRHLLRPGVCEERFGLKVTLNAINPQSIRSIDRKTFESLGRHVQEQTSRPAGATDFGLDIEQDMLRAVTGTPRDPELGSRLHGKVALVANVDFGLDRVVDYLEKCEELAHDDSYKTEYPWVDHISEITDAALKNRLDEELVDRIRDERFDRLWLAVPDRIDWGEVDGFKFSESNRVNTAPDLQFADLLDQLRDPASLTVSQLKSKKAFCFAHDHLKPIHRWSAYQCVCFEVDDGNETYLLSGGKWYRIASSFVQGVNDFVAAMPRSTLKLPACQDVAEGEYNIKVSASDPEFYTLLDAKNVSYGGGHSKIEVCDLLTADRRLVHVKKYGGSSILSHLFAQAAVSGELLFMDADFRAKANLLVPRSKRFPDRLRPADYEVVLAIVTWSKKELTLPFFSRVSLRAATRRLRGFGYKVSMLAIPGPRPSPKT